MPPELPDCFLGRPIAHRALHSAVQGRPENSRAAIRAAVEAGYGVEIDLQLSRDGQAMVFHDYALDRLTDDTGPIRQRSASELAAIPLTGGDEGIPTLAEILSLVDGRVPLLVEIKDQDGGLGAAVGRLERSVAEDVADYAGPIAFMSFNPQSMLSLRGLLPSAVIGLTTSDFRDTEWSLVPAGRRRKLAGIPDLDVVGASFISHDSIDLASPQVARVKARGLPVLCWTICSAEEEAVARRIADNVTFEGYLA